MRASRATVALVLAATLLALAFPPAALALDLLYSIDTSTPEGRAVCSFEGQVLDHVEGNELQVTLTPASGQEAKLTIRFTFFPGLKGATAAGVEDATLSCDIFDPDDASSSVTLPTPLGIKGSFVGILDIHAHPNFNCAASDRGQGTVSAVVNGPGPGGLIFKLKGCDGDAAHANLLMDIVSPSEGTRGDMLTKRTRITNHGPGTATDVTFYAEFPEKSARLDSFSTSQGDCSPGSFFCELGDILVDEFVDITLNLIPLKKGKLKTSYEVLAGNAGDVFENKTKVKTPILQGNNAKLTVSMDCKGTTGTVTVVPDDIGGTTTCTCPDPTTAADKFLCTIEFYGVQTNVTLTATGQQFNKWKGDCPAQPAACTLVLDPAAQNPDKSATAKFRP